LFEYILIFPDKAQAGLAETKHDPGTLALADYMLKNKIR